ncbi:hypothetical protein [Leyella stercorea]|jgi:hypothetical protein|uniref:hypothetical protein n=1 Tax=Leyella stercorea TaxID=363265 RepID=UPI00241C0C59|nr:hypothetical protein [Leyella stercorea]
MNKKTITYKKISVCLILLFSLLLCHACSKDDSNLNTIRVQIEANSDEPIRVYGIKDSGETGLVIKRYFEKTYETESKIISIEANCEDENTLMTIKVWVNGKLKIDRSRNKYLPSGDILL